MRAIVLAAGEGRRLAPFVSGLPKPMAPLGGRPLLEYTLALLRHHGVQEVAINLHHLGDAIATHFGDGRRFGLRLHYLRERRLTGTAGAVRQLRGFLGAESFLVLYGDVLTDLDLTELAAFHRRHRSVATIALCALDDPSKRGVVQLARGDRVTGFVEKPRNWLTPWSNGGIYVLEAGVLEHIPANCEYDFGRDLFPRLLMKGLPIRAFRGRGYLRDIGEPQSYLQAERDLRRGECSTYVDQ
jgi:mannose-1-phosphate guanylyltransferase/phosphomannomutase